MSNGKTILVVDDDADTRATMCDAVGEEGFAAVEAASARDALNALASALQIPSVILTDHRLGDMTGVQLAQRVQSDPRFARVPVIIVSGLAPPSELPDGVAAYLVKPIKLDALLAAIETALNREA